MNYTPNLNLNKPEPAEQYNLEDWNNNSDIIDTAIQNEIDTRKNETSGLTEETNSLKSNLNKLNDDFNNFKESLSYTTYSNQLFNRYTISDTLITAATTENITLSGTQTIDGVSLISGQFVLVKDQTNKSQNGIYEVTTGSWIRLGQGDGAEVEQMKYKYFNVVYGETNLHKLFYCPLDFSNFTLEEDNINFVEHTLFTEMFNIQYPLGFTYPQYPQCKSPMELWGTFSTWQVVDYGGAFFRAEGGNAEDFIEESGDLVAQADTLQGHVHALTSNRIDLLLNLNGSNTVESCYNYKSQVFYSVDTGRLTSQPSNRNTDYGNPRISDETRPVNYTYRIWKRIS